MNAQEFVAAFEHRGYKFRLHPKGGIAIVPTPKLTNGDRANLKLVAADLGRLLREREAHARGLSPADSRTIDRVIEAFPGTQLVEIRPGVPSTPARTKRVRKLATDKQILEALTTPNDSRAEQAEPISAAQGDGKNGTADDAEPQDPEWVPLFAKNKIPISDSEPPAIDPQDVAIATPRAEVVAPEANRTGHPPCDDEAIAPTDDAANAEEAIIVGLPGHDSQQKPRDG
jgi:hypothetical protein